MVDELYELGLVCQALFRDVLVIFYLFFWLIFSVQQNSKFETIRSVWPSAALPFGIVPTVYIDGGCQLSLVV